jgi:pilus assembly protein CpaE
MQGGALYMEEKIDKKRGQMAIFISSKGGVGKTVIAVNVASALASRGFSTCILDGSFQFGDVNIALDIQPRYTISDMIQKEKCLEDVITSNYLYTHNSGLKVLSAPLKPELADLITVPMIPAICKNILKDNTYLIVDLTTGLSEINLNFIELADLIFIVTDLELSALKNTKTMLRTLEKLDMGNKLKVIVNRSDTGALTKASQVPEILKTNQVLYIVDDYKVVSKSLNIGIPFVISKPKEKISSEILSITKEFNCENVSVLRRRRRRQRKKSGFLGIFSR